MAKPITFYTKAKKALELNETLPDNLQIQTIIAAPEDAKFTNQDIYIMYINF